MPGLKGGMGGNNRGLSNLVEVMVKRQSERDQDGPKNTQEKGAAGEVPPILSIEPAEPIKSSSSVSEIYAKNFEKVGPALRQKYENGELPRLHKMFFDAILKEMEGETRKQIILQPVLDSLKIARGQCVVMLACLEHYGYLAVRRLPGKGRRLEFEVLRGK